MAVQTAPTAGTSVKIDCDKIVNWETFHNEFARTFGFPQFYGRNMDAWIDCMSSLDDPDDELSKVRCGKGEVLVLELENARGLKTRGRELYEAIVECAAFVNWRRIEQGKSAVLALSFDV